MARKPKKESKPKKHKKHDPLKLSKNPSKADIKKYLKALDEHKRNKKILADGKRRIDKKYKKDKGWSFSL